MADKNKEGGGSLVDQQVASISEDVQNLEVGNDCDPIAGFVECVEEQVDIPVALDLEAPPENEWYHGRLDRLTAELRLREATHPGSYLVRESERKPGSYVLSFQGKTGINHFRITATCGDYYIGGRQFDSLAELIGYYTSWSDLLKGERLHHPVQPPEPVNDVRKVIALLPYTKMLDTDELSFKKADIFIVHNELGDGWLWVTSQTTQESGIICQDLVEDLNGNVDPVESNDWYHGDITKREAAEKLVKAGPRSFLVRPSDNSPGDYSLFFHCNGSIQRFRIQRQGKLFLMGGRQFDELGAIIKRYTTEQIVEGYTLGKPVLRTRLLESHSHGFRDQTDGESRDSKDIYATMRQSSGSNFLITRKDQIDKKGYLSKKSQKTKSGKWKDMYFVLNATEQHLYFFENEKRTKPKGLIDLSYRTYLYPVHYSFFGRQHCFQLVVRALDHCEVYYLCADSVDQAQEWVQSLKPYCSNTQPRNNSSMSSMLKEYRSLQVTILDAHRLPAKHIPHPYCNLSLNDIKVCGTQVREAPNPIWEEEFTLDDIPSDIDSFMVTMYNKGRRSKDTEVLQVKVELQSLPPGEVTEEWYSLSPVSPTLKGDLGSQGCRIRIRTRFSHEIMMPVEEYTSLKELLIANDFETILAIAKVCGNDRIPFTLALLRVFRHERQEAELLKQLNDMEIQKEDNVGTLFRATSFATTLMDQYMKMTAMDFVKAALQDSIQKILDSKFSCELNPAILDNPSEGPTNTEHLLSLLNDVVQNIFRATERCPLVLRHIFWCLQKSVAAKWPHEEYVKTRVVSGFIFLRLLCPAIINPKLFNLISDIPSETASRTLKLVAKSLQKLANLVEFGAKESFMTVVNPFIVQNKQRMLMFLDELSNVPIAPVVSDQPTGDLARDLSIAHQICVSNLPALQNLCQTKPSLKTLAKVVEVLSNHKNKYLGDA